MENVLVIIAIILFVFAGFGFTPFAGLSLGWVGLAFLGGSFLA